MRFRLDIPAGWGVSYHQFYDEEMRVVNGEIENWNVYKTSLAQFIKMHIVNGTYQIPAEYLLIDLGFYPEGDPNGQFELEMATVTKEDGWISHKVFSSKDRYEIRETLENWMHTT